MDDLRTRLGSALGDRYTIEEEIGRGGMAIVFRAHDGKHDRHVAVKVFRPELSAALGTDRFLREIQLTAQLQHPHIVPLHDSGAAQGLLYYIMPYVVGETLRSRLARETQLPVDEALAIAQDIADALRYAHSFGVVHRDVKPENILLSGGHAMVADFGVAGAISAARAKRLTLPELAVGTAAYMSPEQAAGSAVVDGRSDLYSLGCVLYEMLTGEAPYTATTREAMAARGLQQPPLHVARPSVPSELERAVGKALAELPADRFRTADDMLAALRAAGRETDGLTPASPTRSRLGVTAGITVVAVAALFLIVNRSSPSVPLDDGLYVVFPFEHRAGQAPRLLDGDQCELAVTTVLRGFEDVRTVEHFLVMDAIERRGGGRVSLDQGLDIARSFGGRWVIQGELAAMGESTLVRATLFDARHGRVAGQGTVTISLQHDGTMPEQFRRLVISLLGLEPGIAAVSARSLAANRAFAEARRAVTTGDLRAAADGFTRAATFDTAFAAAHRWAAQTRSWTGASPETWRPAAARAVMLTAREAGGRDHRLARAVLALADGRSQEACTEYHALVAEDASDWVAWVGLGECQARDSSVVRDPDSPSGWRFRASRHAGLAAYRQALALTAFLTPAFYERLVTVVPTDMQALRVGVALPPDTGAFWAHADLAADTFAYVPYRPADLQRGRIAASTSAAAVNRGREIVRDVVAQWAAAYPASAPARAALAETLEHFGRIGADGPSDPSALAAVREARRLAADSARAVRYVGIEVRLRLKAGDVAGAKALADSVLDRWRGSDSATAEPLGALAALTGRAHRAAHHLAGNAVNLAAAARDPAVRTLPLPVLEARERLRAYAALGAPRDSITAWFAEFDRRLTGAIPARDRDRVRAALLEHPAIWLYPVLGLTSWHDPESPNHLLALQARAGRGDRAGARALLAEVGRVRQRVPPGAVSMEANVLEGLVELHLGDTARAVARFDEALAGLPMATGYLLADVTDGAALVRLMALRARLAWAAGDTATAARWARPVRILWSDAAPELRATIADLPDAGPSGRRR